MKKMYLMSSLTLCAAILFFNAKAQAETPGWTLMPLSPTKLSLEKNTSAVVEYLVTNQSQKTYTLALKPMKGIKQIVSGGTCPNPFTLGSEESCTLELEVALRNNFVGGPSICQEGSVEQCFQPAGDDILNINYA